MNLTVMEKMLGALLAIGLFWGNLTGSVQAEAAREPHVAKQNRPNVSGETPNTAPRRSRSPFDCIVSLVI